MSSPLTNDQKARIGQLARAAYQAWPEREAFELINVGFSKTACFTAWRHVEQGKATGATVAACSQPGVCPGQSPGIQSLRACTQAHYGRLKAHFQALAGDTAGAQRTRVRDADNDRRIARYKLAEALRERGLQEGYAAAICKTQYRCALSDASAGQLWRLIYTVRSRKKPTAARPKGEVPF